MPSGDSVDLPATQAKQTQRIDRAGPSTLALRILVSRLPRFS